MSPNSVSPKGQKIQVFARCRPITDKEKSIDCTSVMEVIPEMNKLVLKERRNVKEYFFDKVFSPDTKQITVYETVVEPLVQEVLLGYNCTVFAYGQTGTGKTYTMEGERNYSKCSWRRDIAAGIIPRSLHQLFEELDQAKYVKSSIKVSFFEIYNEEIYDLLSSSDFAKLRLYEDTTVKDSVVIKDIEEVVVKSKDEVYTILGKGAAKRHTAETKLNAFSSRSHAVFTVTVNIIEQTSSGEKEKKIGKLNLVDLAGSEDISRSGAVSKRAREARNINQSLLTLKRVIIALNEKQAHVPYRESKLTRFLQYSLNGHTKTAIIANISPASCNLDETIRTLDYAANAKNIDVHPELNRMPQRDLMEELTRENERLTIENKELIKDISTLKISQGYCTDIKQHRYMQQRIVHLEKELKELSVSSISIPSPFAAVSPVPGISSSVPVASTPRESSVNFHPQTVVASSKPADETFSVSPVAESEDKENVSEEVSNISLEYSYKEGQLKMQYGREFLLKLQRCPMSLCKPNSLPNLDVIKDTSLIQRFPEVNGVMTSQIKTHRGHFTPQHVGGGLPRVRNPEVDCWSQQVRGKELKQVKSWKPKNKLVQTSDMAQTDSSDTNVNGKSKGNRKSLLPKRTNIKPAPISGRRSLGMSSSGANSTRRV